MTEPASAELRVPEPWLQLLMRNRQEGKSTSAIRWVSAGVQVRGYPGWSRVLVVVHRAEFDRLRREYWGALDDFDHRVYEYGDWRRAGHVAPETEVCIDNAEWLLPRMPGTLTRVTMTAKEWAEDD